MNTERTLHDVAYSLSETASDNGFDCGTWDNLPVKIMMVVTELNEARATAVGSLSSAYGLGEDPLREELADIAIRLLSFLHDVWGRTWAIRFDPTCEPSPVSPLFEPIEPPLWKVLDQCSQAVEAWRRDENTNSRMYLEYALKFTFEIAHRVGVDLWTAIEEKDAKNKGRGKLHGKTRSAG